MLFLVAVAALLPPMFTGHAASSGSHDLAIVSLMVHVVAASLWVGGLVCLSWITAIRAANAAGAVHRFSTLAAWCVGGDRRVRRAQRCAQAGRLVGVVRQLRTAPWSWSRRPRSWCSAVLRLAAPPRHDPQPALSRHVPWTGEHSAKLASIEVAIMAATIGVAVALSRTPTPVGDDVYTSPVESLLGSPLPPAPTAARLLFGWTPERCRPARRPPGRVRCMSLG